jgi:hypothetical protein
MVPNVGADCCKANFFTQFLGLLGILTLDTKDVRTFSQVWDKAPYTPTHGLSPLIGGMIQGEGEGVGQLVYTLSFCLIIS